LQDQGKAVLDKLNDTLWACCMTFMTPIGAMKFMLVYGKPYDLPTELEYKAYWAIKHLKFDMMFCRGKAVIIAEYNNPHC